MREIRGWTSNQLELRAVGCWVEIKIAIRNVVNCIQIKFVLCSIFVDFRVKV